METLSLSDDETTEGPSATVYPEEVQNVGSYHPEQEDKSELVTGLPGHKQPNFPGQTLQCKHTYHDQDPKCVPEAVKFLFELFKYHRRAADFRQNHPDLAERIRKKRNFYEHPKTDLSGKKNNIRKCTLQTFTEVTDVLLNDRFFSEEDIEVLNKYKWWETTTDN